MPMKSDIPLPKGNLKVLDLPLNLQPIQYLLDNCVI